MPSEPHKPKVKLSAKQWVLAAIKAYSLFIVGVYAAVLWAEQGIIADDSLLTISLFFVISFLYFSFLKPYLRWYHMIRYVIETFIISLIFAMAFEPRGSTAYEITTFILGLFILFPVVVWILYSLARKRKQLKP